MNYLVEIIDKLGVKIDEVFYLNDNYETKYKFNCNYLLSYDDLENYWIQNDKMLAAILRGDRTIVKSPPPLLYDDERKYLSYVIKPWKDKVDGIYKMKFYNHNQQALEYEFIRIDTKDQATMSFPKFKAGTKYRMMELGHKYSVEDLNL